MTVDELLTLVRRHEVVQTNIMPPKGIAGSPRLRHQELLMFAAVRAILLDAGYSEFESDEIASEVMGRLG
ncbi:hypothetical protein [Burkholderia sp.]|uniref:hypothetical protein n=1 Tax=Burkholderia sp. TaxID=36773 RepID=UPI0025C3F993|nr:hypothetical protein [Burkholderia sp.]MBS6360657.1 hypothetical protein [Burkholderia sp.]